MGQIIFKAIFILIILAALALVGYAYLGDMNPSVTDSRVPVDLNVSQ